jgi:hypothetical protein
MKIQLYLDRINQEMIEIGPGRRVRCIYVSWTKECCILHFGRVRSEPGEENGLMLRKEETGGLLWDARSGAVYSLDEEAYNALLELENGYRPSIVAKRIGVTTKKMNTLIAQLKELGLYA